MVTNSERITDAVRLLLAPPSPEQRALLEAVAGPFLQTGEWPVMDYVDAVLDAQGLDVWQVRETFPSWPVRYSAIWPGPGSLVNAEDKIGLTVAGLELCAASFEDARAIVEDYLAVLRYLADRFREASASPNEARRVEMTSDDLGSRLEELGRVVSLQEKAVRCAQIYSLWEHEFTGWKAGSTIRSLTDWSVIVRREITAHAQVTDVEDYLTGIARYVLPAEPQLPPPHPSSLTLPEAIDYLDTVWRVRFKQRLFNLPGAAKTASLSLPCATSDEFDSRLSALSDLLDRMTVLPPDSPLAKGHASKSIGILRAFLVQELPADAHTRVEEAVTRLQKIVALRRGRQHHGASADAVSAAEELGFAEQIGRWEPLWQQVQAATVQALNAIREELQSADDIG